MKDTLLRREKYVNEKTTIRNRYFIKVRAIIRRYGVPNEYFSLGGYSEDSICLEKEQNFWYIYLGERGNKVYIRQYTTLKDACRGLIEYFASGSKYKNNMLNDFDNELKRLEVAEKTRYKNSSTHIPNLKIASKRNIKFARTVSAHRKSEVARKINSEK